MWLFLLEFWEASVHSVVKLYLHFTTGHCELVRICSERDGRHTPEMSSNFAVSLKHSKQLRETSRIVFSFRSFSAVEAVQTIQNIKQERFKPVVLANMVTCMQSLRMFPVVYARLESLRKESFDYHNAAHVAMLERLWTQLKPHQGRSTNRLSAEWGDIGFQGHDPATDFRGMGLLGLIQLVHFSEHHSAAARDLLQESLVERRYFPFSATGINMTALVMELMHQHQFHRYIFEQLDRIFLMDASRSPEGPSDDVKCVEAVVRIVHDLYAQIYIDFGKLWVKSNPQDIMAFPTIFAEFKKSLKEKFVAI